MANQTAILRSKVKKADEEINELTEELSVVCQDKRIEYRIPEKVDIEDAIMDNSKLESESEDKNAESKNEEDKQVNTNKLVF